MDLTDAQQVSFGPDDTFWSTTATYKLTNTKGTDGAGSNLRLEELWRTDAKTGSFTKENGTDGSDAVEIHEAAFPDGEYTVHTFAGGTSGRT